MQYPKLSIITPSYNQGRFLEATIRSVLDQKYPNLEFIVIDGGSTDNSVEILRRYDKDIAYWISEKDAGQSDALNKGLERCTGDLIGWINSDDVYMPNAFRSVVAAFQKNAECVAVHGERILINEFGAVVGWTSLPPFDPQSGGFNVCSETAFWRREAGQVAGKIKTDLRFAMDLEFFSRLYKVGKFCKLDVYLGCFRCHGDNKSSTIYNSVGVKEAESEWKRIFGSDNQNWSVAPKPDKLRHRLALLRYPRKITIPYLRHRFFRP